MPRRSISGKRWGSAKQKAALEKAQLISARKRRGTGDIDGGSNRRRRAVSMDLLKATVRSNIESDYLERSHASNAKGKGFLKGHEVASRRLGTANLKRDQARTKLDIEHLDRRGKAVAAYQDRQAREARKAQTPKRVSHPVQARRAAKAQERIEKLGLDNAKPQRKAQKPTGKTKTAGGAGPKRPFEKYSDADVEQAIRDTKKTINDTRGAGGSRGVGSVLGSAHRAAKENLADLQKEQKLRKQKPGEPTQRTISRETPGPKGGATAKGKTAFAGGATRRDPAGRKKRTAARREGAKRSYVADLAPGTELYRDQMDHHGVARGGMIGFTKSDAQRIARDPKYKRGTLRRDRSGNGIQNTVYQRDALTTRRGMGGRRYSTPVATYEAEQHLRGRKTRKRSGKA